MSNNKYYHGVGQSGMTAGTVNTDQVDREKLNQAKEHAIKQMRGTRLTFICDKERHLICEPYSIENLHRMARILNIHRRWYHKGNFPHYDIPQFMVKSVMEKCKVVTPRELLSIIKSY